MTLIHLKHDPGEVQLRKRECRTQDLQQGHGLPNGLYVGFVSRAVIFDSPVYILTTSKTQSQVYSHAE